MQYHSVEMITQAMSVAPSLRLCRSLVQHGAQLGALVRLRTTPTVLSAISGVGVMQRAARATTAPAAVATTTNQTVPLAIHCTSSTRRLHTSERSHLAAAAAPPPASRLATFVCAPAAEAAGTTPWRSAPILCTETRSLTAGAQPLLTTTLVDSKSLRAQKALQLWLNLWHECNREERRSESKIATSTTVLRLDVGGTTANNPLIGGHRGASSSSLQNNYRNEFLPSAQPPFALTTECWSLPSSSSGATLPHHHHQCHRVQQQQVRSLATLAVCSNRRMNTGIKVARKSSIAASIESKNERVFRHVHDTIPVSFRALSVKVRI